MAEPDDPLAQLDDWARRVERKARRRERLRGLARTLAPGNRSAAIAVALVMALLCTGATMFWRDTIDRATTAYPTAAVPSGIAATSGTGSGKDGPFTGTPAQEFPEGESGLVFPAAQGVGTWSETEVSAALATVRAALVAAYLDHRMLIDHDPSKLLELLAPDARENVAYNIERGRYGTTAVRIAKEARLLDVLPRVSGRTTYREAVWGTIPVLEVVTNYVWAYPFEVPSGSRVVVVHSEQTWRMPKDGTASATYRGLMIGDSHGYWFGMDCTQALLGFTAPDRDDAAPTGPRATAAEAASAYYQPDHALDVQGGCPH